MPLERQTTALAPLMDGIVATFAPLAQERGVNVVAEARDPVSAYVDAGALRQIVLNLLDNATKFGPRGQTVRLTVEQADDRARIAVEDQGPGIAIEDRERIWSPYVRLRRERSAANEGSGIGLAVVRELTQLHGGSAVVQDAAGGGARFVIELPMAAPATDGRTPPAIRREPVRPREGWAGRARRRLTRGVDTSARR
jgi:signal transduction histidine kinase